MIAHPILFQPNMVQAILDSKKTQTRRVIKMRDGSLCEDDCIPANDGTRAPYVMDFTKTFPQWQQLDCPYGQPGDGLWVKETFAKSPTGFIYRADWEDGHGDEVVDLPTGRTIPLVWKSSRFMPRKASRITLEIVNIRVERLQDITDDDAIQEGVDRTNTSIPGYARTRFMYLWKSIYFSHPEIKWSSKPWVWVIEFKRVL